MRASVLTDKFCRKAPAPATGRVEYYDAVVRGLSLRVTATGARSWSFLYRVRGTQKRATVPFSVGLAEARTLARELLVAAERGVDLLAERAARTAAEAAAGAALKRTVAICVDEYLRVRCAKVHRPRTYQEVARIFSIEVLPTLGGRPLEQVTKGDLLRLLDRIAERHNARTSAQGAVAMARRVRAHLGAFYKWAVGRDYVPVNLVASIEPVGKEAERDRVLSDDELGQLLPHLPPVGLVQLATACRGGEAQAMAWADVDLDRRTWRIPADLAKTGRARLVPLSRAAVDLLRRLQADARGPWVFPGRRPGRVLARGRQAVAKAIEAAGLVNVTPHDLRRAAATGMEERLKVPRIVVHRLLGHADGDVTGVYARAEYFQEQAEAVERWAAHLRALSAGEARGAPVIPLEARQA